MGPVFRAYDAERERLVAIKLFRLDLPPERVHQLVAAFEQLVGANLNHPAIARPVATGMSGVAAYLAQDYIAAESLDLVVREHGSAPAADALRVATQLAGALDFAAVVNVHHGALHPRDILVSPEETRLTGIGVAQALQTVGVAVPVRRPYTAPEILAPDSSRGSANGNGSNADSSRRSAYGAKADQFSLAAVIFEMLTAKRVAGFGDAAVEAMADVPGADSDALRGAFARALAEAPEQRFDSGLEFVEALKRALAQPRKPRTKPQPTLLLPLEEPEISDRPDVEVPIAVPEAPEPLLREAAVPDLPLAAPLVAAPPAAPIPDVPPAAIPDVPPAPVQHEVFSSALEQSRSAVWPLILALGVGLAVGFAGGYSVGGHHRTQPPPVVATSGQGREFTDATVKPDDSGHQPSAISPEPSKAISPEPSKAISPEPSKAVGPAPSKAPQAPPGRLVIRSMPAGARVMIDGKDAGVTPASVGDLTLSPHDVRVSHNGYVDFDRRIVLTRAAPEQAVVAPLARERAAAHPTAARTPAAPQAPATPTHATGALSVDSRPVGAKVFLDGKLIGTTPLALPSIPAGDHAVRLELGNYRHWTSSVRIVAGEPNRVTASLER